MAFNPSQTVVLITGSNQGIGFETARLLAESSRPYHVILTGRSSEKATAAAQKLQSSPATRNPVTPMVLDVSSPSSLSAAVAEVTSKFPRLDVLVNNAGIALTDGTGPALRDTFRQTFETNVFGAACAVEEFLPLLRKSSRGARIIYVSSGLGSLAEAADPGNRHYNIVAKVYRSTKAAINMVMLQDLKRLHGEGMMVWGLCPGWLATNLSQSGRSYEELRQMGAGEPVDGGILIVDVVEGRRDGDVGRMVWKDGVRAW